MADVAHKQAIARAFGRSASCYDRFADFQRECGERLLARVAQHPGDEVLDAGCGTGYFSRRWQTLGKRVTALDLSEAMLAQAREHNSAASYRQGDIERLPLPDASVDIGFSNLAIQWCDSLPQALAELYRVTRPGGVIAFSTLAAGSLDELRRAWHRLDGSRRVNRFLPAAAIEDACRRYRYQLTAAPTTCFFPDVLSLMRSLKGVGATWLHEGRAAGCLSRGRLAALAERYPRQPQGYPLTYQQMLGVIERD